MAQKPLWEERPVTQPTSPVFFDTIKTWLKECEAGRADSHRMCLPGEANQFQLPTRLLEIVQERGEFKVSLKVACRETLRYATLSHCWGEHQPLRTTKENLDDHLKEIKWSSLPRTFQDAVMISCSLGICYLWIDSLCIVQDDEVDWAKEAARMKDIYARSYITFAAAIGKDSRYGLFSREPEAVSICEGKGPKRCARYTVWTTSVLSTRAWVMQERLLSRRTLYFYEDEVLLECPSAVRCQCGGETSLYISNMSYQSWALTWGNARQCTDNDTILYRFTQARRHINDSSRNRQPDGEETRGLAPCTSNTAVFALVTLWDELLEHYCQRNITKLSDRLPAFAGIARAFGNSGVLGKYTSGLWDGLFLPLMLWYIEPTKSPKLEQPSKADSALAPSWSWASVSGAWCYSRIPFSYEFYAMAKPHQPGSMPQSHNYLGALKTEVITIEGCIATATIHYNTLYPGFQQDHTYTDRFKAQRVKLVADDEYIEMWPDFVMDALENPVNSGELVYCLPIQGNSESEPRVIQGLVLRINEQDPALFSRIGIFQCHTWFGSAKETEVKIC
ncbi:heterokaryon incompatibility protein-domain-containing protein [Tricladium varicosporioides]|nr:heterokaryon incompatibility protein-domain-containing protein [Hymenoscyphus varicosporioides]